MLNEAMKQTLYGKTFISSNEITITSKTFDDYVDCVASLKKYLLLKVQEMVENHKDKGAFLLGWESNPFLDGRVDEMTVEEVLRHQLVWNKEEIMKMYVVNQKIKTPGGKFLSPLAGVIRNAAMEHPVLLSSSKFVH